MKDFTIPIKVELPETGEAAEEMTFRMPSGMETYSMPEVPEAEDMQGLDSALQLSSELLALLQTYRVGTPASALSLDHLDKANRQFFDHLLGDGEVSLQFNGEKNVSAQESVLAGVWRVQYLNQHNQVEHDTIEVGDVPAFVKNDTFSSAQTGIDVTQLEVPEDVYNAPPLLAELSDKLAEQRDENSPAHVINLSLLPHTERDIVYLSEALDIGPTIILSRGYGNCRISSTGTHNVWWVQYFNAQETLILNTLEIASVPEVACAAQQDIEDSTERLQEILSIYRQ